MSDRHVQGKYGLDLIYLLLVMMMMMMSKTTTADDERGKYPRNIAGRYLVLIRTNVMD